MLDPPGPTLPAEWQPSQAAKNFVWPAANVPTGGGGGGGAAVVHTGALMVTTPLVQLALAVPDVGATMSLSAEVLPLVPPA
jgi:hypothetical protein